MFISSLAIENFRGFKNQTIIEFNEGLNIIIGENNAGKTTVLKALQLIFDINNNNRLSIDDINKDIDNFTKPPVITITATIKSSKSDRDIDKALVASWLTKLESPWEAQLTYQFFLPDEHLEEYRKVFEEISQDSNYKKLAYEKLEQFIPLYKTKIFGGNPDVNIVAEREWLSKFNFQLLGPLRDAESEIYLGKNPLLKNFLKKALSKYQKIKPEECEQNKKQLKTISEKLVNELNQSEQFKSLINFANNTGASYNNESKPNVKGLFEEEDIIESLKLLIAKNNFDIPITLNGLGYNNLLYISLILANFDDELINKQGTIFPILLIEEPEAHLHPALQYNFINYIYKNHKEAKQIFITSHSTHITSAVSLDNIICLSENKGELTIVRPGLAFYNTNEDKKSKKYIERYLDATKSNLLFSKGIIFVEGLTEQLLIPCLADYIEDSILEKSLTSVIRVDGSCFKHFLKLFDSRKENYLSNKKVACIIDTDPAQRFKKDKKFKACFPCELDIDKENYEYRNCSPIITNLKTDFNLDDNYEKENIKICFSEIGKGKTFEYDFARENSTCNLLLVDTCSNLDNLILLQKSDKTESDKNKINDLIGKFKFNKEKEPEKWLLKDDESKERFACYYLNCVKDNKGEVAFDLGWNLRNNLQYKYSEDSKEKAKYKSIVIPKHIEDAIKWASDR